jgi:predicted metal-binding protein
MDSLQSKIIQQAEKINLNISIEFDPGLLLPEQKILAMCIENKCGNFENNHMCPPATGELEENTIRLSKYEYGIFFQYLNFFDVKNDTKALKRSKIDFHKKILQMESFIKDNQINELWSFIGGACVLCNPCEAVNNKPCKNQKKARTSLEAIGINVISILKKLDLDTNFYPDRVLLSGCILYS